MYKVERGQTPNVSTRKIPATGYMLHKTYGSYSSAKSWLMNKDAQASAEIIIDKDGTQFRMTKPDIQIAWHAGVTNENGHKYGKKYGVPMSRAITAWLDKVGNRNPNHSLIGIEFVSFGEAVTEDQIASFWSYAHELNKAYGIPLPTTGNTFYHNESAYWKEKVEKTRVLAGEKQTVDVVEDLKQDIELVLSNRELKKAEIIKLVNEL